MKTVFFAGCLLISFSLSAQVDNEIFTRMQAISNEGTDFYNIDGISITTETYTNSFSEDGFKKPFRKYSVKKDDIKDVDTSLPFKNFHLSKSEILYADIKQHTSLYFIENKDKWVTIISFNSAKEPDVSFERDFIKMIYNKTIPKSVFAALRIDSINFAGRKIPLGRSCNWMNINNVQCPYYGQMNWSVHKELSDAQSTLNIQLEITKLKKGVKVISENEVDIIFEGNPTKAKKIVYDFTGVKSLLAGLSGGKTLTVFYVATGVRNNFVSCVLSFWNNDNINPSGLPPLLENVMKLQ